MNEAQEMSVGERDYAFVSINLFVFSISDADDASSKMGALSFGFMFPEN